MPLNKPYTLFFTATLLVRDKSISQLWEINVLGIQDPVMKRSAAEEEQAVQNFFEKSVTTEDDGRYKVSLLWKEGHPPLPSNISIATKRLENTMNKVRKKESWRYVPGSLNPAVLVSLGCSAKKLYKLKWLEGTELMRNSHDEWPICDEEATSQETNKGIVTSMMTTENTNNSW